SETKSGHTRRGFFDQTPAPQNLVGASGAIPEADGTLTFGKSSHGNASGEGGASAEKAEVPAPASPSSNAVGAAPAHPDVERAAQVVLAADPADVGDDTSQVFETVHTFAGIVMRSSTSKGRAGRAGASFDLLIPTAKLGDALAA